MTMMSEDEFNEQMDKVANARTERDRAIQEAQDTFTDVVIATLEAGLTLSDISHATGVSQNTLRVRLRERGVPTPRERA